MKTVFASKSISNIGSLSLLLCLGLRVIGSLVQPDLILQLLSFLTLYSYSLSDVSSNFEGVVGYLHTAK